MMMKFLSLFCRKYLHVFPKNCTKRFCSDSLHPVPDLQVYNSLTKSKSPVLTKHSGVVGWYICGPTVYDDSHVGHAWCYVNFDIMRRVMEHYFDLTVVQVMNITDIDDKIIQKADEQTISFKEIASKYEISFLNDLNALSVKSPTILTRVSDFIPQIITFIERLLDQNLAYKTIDGSVYFNLNSYSKMYKYGKLKPFQMSNTDGSEIPSSHDFALWKAAKSSSEPGWTPSWGGKGRPGWHIECSAMASYIFGSWVDVHSGGIDLLFPHHENEEAQCCAYHGNSQWVGHWIHANLLNLSDGVKMSKSQNNVLTIKEFLESHTADEFRMLCTISSYRNGIEYSEESLKLAKGIVDTIRVFIMDCHSLIRKSPTTQTSVDPFILLTALNDTKKVVKARLGDDFNTAQATHAVQKLVKLTNSEMRKPTSFDQNSYVYNHGVQAVSCVLDFVSNYFSILGFNSIGLYTSNTKTDSSPIIDDFVEFRNQVRQHALSIKSSMHQKHANDEADLVKTKNVLLTECDRVRENLKLKGIQLKDHGKNATWTLAK